MSDDFERELEESLKRVAPPEGFADRVMARVSGHAAPEQRQPRLLVLPLRTGHAWRAVAAVALVGVLLGAAEVAHERQEKRQAEMVQQKFDIAMQITQKTLDGVSRRISQAGTRQEKGEQ